MSPSALPCRATWLHSVLSQLVQGRKEQSLIMNSVCITQHCVEAEEEIVDVIDAGRLALAGRLRL